MNGWSILLDEWVELWTVQYEMEATGNGGICMETLSMQRHTTNIQNDCTTSDYDASLTSRIGPYLLCTTL